MDRPRKYASAVTANLLILAVGGMVAGTTVGCKSHDADVEEIALADQRYGPFTSSHDDQNAATSAVLGPVPESTLKQAVSGPTLQSTGHSFALVQGNGGTFKVYYDDPDPSDNAAPDWFLSLHVPQSARLTDESGRPLEKGDTLHVRVTVHPASFLAHFEPHGAEFTGDHPATLSFNYKHADLGEGDPGDLGIWYQATAEDEWAKEATEVDIRGSRVVMHLLHFSNYAVAF